jgi:hypothetical protein
VNLQYLILRKHIFKKRKFSLKYRRYNFRYGSLGLFSLIKQRFELLYFRFFRKIIFRKIVKRKVLFKKRRSWVFLFPNHILTKKSTNARMGAGVGAFVRVCIVLKSYQSFIEFSGFSAKWCSKLFNLSRYRYNIKYIVVTK